MRWGAAVILGGGAAGAVQAGTVLARLKSTFFTGGAGNFVVALFEPAGAARRVLSFDARPRRLARATYVIYIHDLRHQERP